MKTIQKLLPIRNLHANLALVAFMVVMFIVACFQEVIAQGSEKFQNDPHFPGRHNFNAGIYTTYRGSSAAAPVLIGEFNYGLKKRFSLGLIGGTTGTLGLLGVRMAVGVYQKENFRLLYRMSIIYYPERHGTFLFDKTNKHVMPWMLSMGFLDAEWRTGKGIRWSIGMGLIETHCVDGMMNLLGRTPGPGEEADLELEVFNTIQGSVAIPLSKRFTLRPEAIAALSGVQFVSGDDHKVTPLYLYLHLVYTF